MITNLVANASLNAKINKVKGEIPTISNIASTNTLVSVENMIPNVSNLVKENWLQYKNYLNTGGNCWSSS